MTALFSRNKRFTPRQQRGFFKPLFAFLMSGIFSPVFAAEVATTAATSASEIGASVVQPSDYFLQIVVSLVLVLLIIFFSAWMLRRYGRYPGVADGHLKVLGALSVGQRERILLLQAGEEQIVVGVTTSQISHLHTLQEPVEVKEPKPLNGPFAQRLQEALQAKKPVNKDSNSEMQSENKDESHEAK